MWVSVPLDPNDPAQRNIRFHGWELAREERRAVGSPVQSGVVVYLTTEQEIVTRIEAEQVGRPRDDAVWAARHGAWKHAQKWLEIFCRESNGLVAPEAAERVMEKVRIRLPEIDSL